MAINFGLLNTNAPAELGATFGNALALRRQRDLQDEQLGQQRQQFQIQNALANMQLQKAQSDAAEEAAYKNALGNVQSGDMQAAMPQLMQASPSRAMALQKQLSEMQKGQIEQKSALSKIAHDKLGMYREQLTNVNTPQQFAQWLTAQHSDPDLAPLMSSLPSLEDSLATIPQDPRQFQEMKLKSAVGLGKYMEMTQPKPTGPTDLSRMIAERDALPVGDQRRQLYDQAINKATTHAPAAVTNVNMTQEKEESKAVGKGFGEQYNAIQKSGLDAGGKISRYERMSQLLQGVSTGTLTPTTTQISALADSVGLSIDPKLPAKQAAEALSNEIALQLRNPSGGAGMPGALSDKDREFLVSMTPGLSKTPEGNRIIIDTAIKLAKREQEVAKIARDYRKRNGTLDEGFYNELDSFSAKNPLFPVTAAPTAQAAPRTPTVGAVQDGYRFKGGNPADPKSWEKVQ